MKQQIADVEEFSAENLSRSDVLELQDVLARRLKRIDDEGMADIWRCEIDGYVHWVGYDDIEGLRSKLNKELDAANGQGERLQNIRVTQTRLPKCDVEQKLKLQAEWDK